ncbi:MAG TPA: PSD1 and planctomycete cytochrome C domain-containing protein, partial [Planctomycetaceae bacterium]|nr:PSD1 and planctomycete cytochrome C domain-containing protein [Planctomycetaceae bacterium]
DIRPILSDNCFACHGPDEGARESGLRIDLKPNMFAKADSDETIVVPGKPADSELYRRLTSDDPDTRMPPAESTKVIKPEQRELIRKWIEQGAVWQDHWAYQPPVRPELPEVKHADRVRNPIDRFILARLEKEGLTPSEQADKATLLRRVTFDLTGVPPTIQEIEYFLNDDSPDAYENVVDRLLQSPRYGEHMARFWLDAVRYGDTHGLHLDNYREIWPYRDWVIQAFNENMPFDQFATEQLAGDLLENATRDQQIATGYIRCNVSTSEGGSISEEVYVRNVVDRVVNFGTVFMGTTFDCTRCHDHKFDPLTQHDFYSLFAYFNSIDGSPLDGNKKDHEPVLPVPDAEQEQQLAELNERIAALQKSINQPWPEVDAEQIAWERKVLDNTPGEKEPWTVLIPQEYRSAGAAELKLLDDNSLLASGPNPAKETYEIIGTLDGAKWQTIRLEGLIDPSLTNGGAGRSANSNVVLTDFEAYLASPDKPEEWTRIPIREGWADHEQGDGNFKIANALDGKPDTGWAIEGHAKKENRLAYFLAEKPFAEQSSLLKVVLKHESVYAQHQFGRVRLSVSESNPIGANVPEEFLAIIKLDTEKRNEEQSGKLQKHFRETVTQTANYVETRTRLAEAQKAKTDLEQKIPTTLVMKELAEPRKSFILNRGEYDQQKDEVARRTPARFSPLKEDWPNNRLGLAKWLVSEEHPLTARVAVNRMWQQVFGTGIVKTSEDFGSQGEPPSHPQLLDWLAVEFRETGWDTKSLLKTLVMSGTYRQSSKITPQLFQKDPANRLLARGPRFRLDAEMLRDQALAVSGLLHEKLGGPSVKPPQPDGLWFAVGYSGSNTVRFVADTGSDKIHRRTLYTFIKRTAPPPQMGTFDAPSREASCVRRERTNTPLQALLLFNDPQYIEAARALAQRTLNDVEGDSAARASYMFRLCTGRLPIESELAELVEGLTLDLQHYTDHPEAAKQLVSPAGEPPAGANVPELAAWTMTANLMLNLDEVVNKN